METNRIPTTLATHPLESFSSITVRKGSATPRGLVGRLQAFEEDGATADRSSVELVQSNHADWLFVNIELLSGHKFGMQMSACPAKNILRLVLGRIPRLVT